MTAAPAILERGGYLQSDRIRSKIYATVADQLAVKKWSLRQFIPAAWHVIEPAREFLPAWHIDCISEHLEAVDAGQIKRLIVNIPPRFGKSSQVTVLWPAWSWTVQPWSRWIFSSYAASLSVKHSRERRLVIESDWYRQMWGGRVMMAADQNQKSEFQNTARGMMVATSVGGSITGKGANRIVIDDSINPFDAESKAARAGAILFFRNTLSTRLDDPKTGAIVIVEQRTHKSDLTGTLLADGGWDHLRLPATADKRERVIFPMSGRTIDREIGDLLWPERQDEASLAKQRVSMGSRAFAAQFQQAPAAEQGAILKRAWWKYYRELPKVRRSVWLWDTAVKKGQNNDFTAGLLMNECENGWYISDHVKKRLEFPELILLVKQKFDARKAHRILIEDKSSGQQLIQVLKRETRLPVAHFDPGTADKELRANQVAPLLEAGKVFLPEGAAWVDEFEEVCAAFPDVDHDDEVDALTMGLLHFTAGPRLRISGANETPEDD